MRAAFIALILVGVAASSVAVAAGTASPLHFPAFSLAAQAAAQPPVESPANPEDAPKTGTEVERYGEYRHKGVSDLFNIREANADVERGEWELEARATWMTYSKGERDEVELSQAVYYGITDSLFVELEVEQPLGYGGDGVGELYLTLFQQILREKENCPAFAVSGTLRIPTGHESSGVDGRLNAIVTKTLLPKFRAHFQGFVMTANGAPGYEEEDERESFQWGLGPGFDYEFCPGTLGVVNFLHRNSEEEHQHNNNILELGVVQDLQPLGGCKQRLKAALDIGLDGAETTPNLGTKFLWELEF